MQGVWVEPTPELFSEDLKVWVAVGETDMVRVPGYWQKQPHLEVPAGAVPQPAEKVVLFFHGGGYIRLSAHPSSPTAAITKQILKSTPSIRRTFALEYRLSSTEPYPRTGSFPAAFVDALAGYVYLVKNVGFAPEDIIIVGDSAGGNLGLALTRYLVDHKGSIRGLPAPPGGLVLLSPWADLSNAHENPENSTFTNEHSDFISPPVGKHWGKEAYVGAHGFGAAMYNPYISPASPDAHARFKGFPKTFIHAGTAELLYDQITTLADYMQRDIGDAVTYRETTDAVRSFVLPLDTD